MRLLHVIRSVNPAHGGPIEGIWKQAAATLDAGMAVEREIVTLDAPNEPFLERRPVAVPIHALGSAVQRRLPGKLRTYGDPRPGAHWLRANAARFDCAIVHGIWNAAGCAARMALPGRLPYFVFTHGMLDRWFAQAYPLKHGGKQLSWSMIEGPLLANARSVLFTSEEERLRAQDVFRGHAYRSQLVDYGTEPLAGDDARDAGRDVDGYLLFLGRIHRKKGLDMLIEAMGRLPRAECPRLVVVGPDQEGSVEALRQRAADLGIAGQIDWRGPIYGADKATVMREAAAFILPSHQENFGIAVAEALSVGTPVLITDKVAIWREVESAGAGLVEPDTVEGVTVLLRRWSALGTAQRRDMSKAARGLFDERFDVRRTGPDLIRMIEREIAADRPAGGRP